MASDFWLEVVFCQVHWFVYKERGQKIVQSNRSKSSGYSPELRVLNFHQNILALCC